MAQSCPIVPLPEPLGPSKANTGITVEGSARLFKSGIDLQT
jgi:hypothetical protein